jgi:hypothetical protein
MQLGNTTNLLDTFKNNKQKNSSMKVYISGPITGRPPGEAENHFLKMENLLKETLSPGTIIVNPMTLNHRNHNQEWEEFMKRDITALLTCTVICMLKGWEKSKGASIERALATTLKLTVIYEENKTLWD